MKQHRGFELIECVCCHPPEHAGERLVSVHDDLAGIVGDFQTELEAVQWIDNWCFTANQMLERATER